MVRTEARSTACLTCLKRKKGCDRQIPFCGQCRKACIPCQGYRRPFGFRHYTSEEGLSSLAARTTRALNDNPAPNTLLCRSMMRSANLLNILGRFWEAYLPNGSRLDPQLATHSTWGVVEFMEISLLTEGISQKAAAALCLATVGAREDDLWLKENSLRYYTEALQGVAAALGRPRKDGGIGLISAIRIFSIYEAFCASVNPMSPTKPASNWMAHIAGEIALFRTNGPSFYDAGLAHRLFVDDRLFLICVAFEERKASFLNSEEWMTLPWNIIPKTPRDKILDILVEVPALLALIDTYHTTVAVEPLNAEEQRQQIIQFCLSLHERLAQWCAEHHALVLSASKTTVPWDMNLPCPLSNSVEIAWLHVMVMYWITSALIDVNLCTLLKNNDALPRNPNPEASCSKIIIALSNLLHPSIGFYRIHLVAVPLGILEILLKDSSIQHSIIQEEKSFLRRRLLHPGCASISKFTGKVAALLS